MRVLIIEDEVMAAKALKKVLKEVEPDVEVMGILETIEESVEWLQKKPLPDLMFMDIHLADGSSFAIFEQVSITCPVIFTTAYDEYALQAFEVNSIDYLLKPISKDALSRAMHKYHNLMDRSFDSSKLETLLTQLGEKKKYRSCFLLPERDKLVPLPVGNIAYVFIDSKTVKIISLEQKTYYITQTLDDLMAQLDPSVFFRANRQFIVSRQSIKDVSVWFGNKLAINLVVETPEKIIVSKARVSEFKHWFSN
ncbi:MAG: response regulator transcription factor [Bacteroidales bacterium]|nr:response regulator transcription factor [Bacteroidales bacterium]